MNYYNVKFNLSDNKSRVVKDVKSKTHEAAKNKAIDFENVDKVVIEIENTVYEINRDHLVEIIVEKVDNPDEREKKRQDNLNALSNINF